MYRGEIILFRRLLLAISKWIQNLAHAKFLTQILQSIQIKRKIEELTLSLIDRISVLQVRRRLVQVR